MTFRQSFYFAMRLSWRQLTYERTKLFAGLVGVVVACVLVFMQLGFKDSLYRSVTLVPGKFNGQLFVISKQAEAIWRTASFPLSKLKRIFAHPEVEAVTPIYIGMGSLQSSDTMFRHTIMIYAGDPLAHPFSSPEIDANIHKLTHIDTALYDEYSHPEYGPIIETIAQGKMAKTEVNYHKMNIVGTYKAGASFASDGGILMSDRTFIRVFPSRNMRHPDVGVIRLKPSADPLSVQSQLRLLIDDEVRLYTFDELINFEKKYWQEKTPVGFIFGFGTVMGLVVGLAVVYQILYTSIANRLNEFATLKAMGYTQSYMLMLVISSSLLFAVIGFIPGYVISYFLYILAASATLIPMQMTSSLIMMVFFLVFLMCVFAGLLAMDEVRSADPADVF